MTREPKQMLAMLSVVLIVGAIGFAGIAMAQGSETVTVKIGTGTVMHRSGNTVILDVTEGGGEQGLGLRKINVKTTDGVMFHDRTGTEIGVNELKKGDRITAYRTEQRPAPVKITYSEAEEIMKVEPAAPRSEPSPAPTPAPAEQRPAQLPSTGSYLPLILLLAVLSLSVALTLNLVRRRV